MPVRIACFAMSDSNHFASFGLLIAELVRQGAEVRVWTDASFRTRVEVAGASFADVFANRALNAIDDASRPFPARFVTFAAVHGRAIADDVRAWGADLVVYESFAYVGRVVAQLLALPWVPLLNGHYIDGPATRAALPTSPRTAIDPRCHSAVQVLQRDFELADATPFAYVAQPSPHLTIAAVPEEWYSREEVAQFGPLAFFGCLEPKLLSRPPLPRAPNGPLRIYASMGTIVWRYWTSEALATLHAVRAALDGLPDATAVMALGGADISTEQVEALRAPATRVERYADQAAELADADIFVCHMGAGSVHEAIALAVPMLSHPFFWDQPGLARRAAEFGVATPLLPGAIGPEAVPSAADVRSAIAEMQGRREEMVSNLDRARAWDLNANAARPAVARRIIALAED